MGMNSGRHGIAPVLRFAAALLLVGSAGIACAKADADPAKSVSGATAAMPSGADQQARRVRRLSALAALWGEVRYFHPYLATRDVDWDRALVEAIPRVEAASDSTQYRAAVGRMLDVLGDPATRVLAPVASVSKSAQTDLGDPALAVSEHDGVVRIDFARLAEIAERGGSTAGMQAALAPAMEAMGGATLVVLDARAHRPEEEVNFSIWMINGLLSGQSNAALQPGSLRYRRYNGYVSQTGSHSSGGYSAGMITDNPVPLPAMGSAPLPPMVVLVNADSALPGEVLVGLQATGRAIVIAEGSADFGASPESIDLGEGLRAQVRTTELIAPDGRVGFHADMSTDAAGSERAVAAAMTRLKAASAPGNKAAPPPPAQQLGDADRPYAQMQYPSREYRLLALFRAWNVIDKFFPYRDLIGPGWDSLLARYIPKLEAAGNAVEYQLALRQLAAELHDSHAALGGTTLSAEWLGRYLPPAIPIYLEGQTVIAKVFDEARGLRVGDVIVSVDGKPISQLRARMASYTSGSTEQALMRDVHRSLLRGQKDSALVLGVRGVDGRMREASLTRSVYANDPRLYDFEGRSRPTPVYGLLKKGLGYVDLARLEAAQVDAMFEAIKGTPATIFDMRGYPNGTAWPIAPRLTTRKNPVASLFRSPFPEGLSRADSDLRDAVQLTNQRLPDADGAPYLGKVVMLVNEWTQSQAESTAMFFEAATDVTFIGTPTAGADGDVTEMVLPGAISFQFSGHDVRHADGRQLQRLGIQPHVLVAPTIGGLVRGEDEVLAKAVEFLLLAR